MAAKLDSQNYHAIVDIGSNGVRFSITNLAPTKARIMPTVFQDRASISLYDAQYSDGKKQPISEDVILELLQALKSFKRTCRDFGVPTNQIRLVATEAMREALNSHDLRQEIRHRLGWDTEMLAKEDESRIGAMGVASSLDQVIGLVMDLGGGSVQIAWMETKEGEVDVLGTTSLPYGAAALTRRMQEATDESALERLSQELQEAFKTTIQKINHVSNGRINDETGCSIYLSGGGFRGWGQVLMDEHKISPYPIPIINGFRVGQDDFQNVERISGHVKQKTKEAEDIFRISKRRATQIPAVSLLIAALTKALPMVRDVYFAQGGVREGTIFSTLPPQIRAKSPIATSAAEYAPPGWSELLQLFNSALPLKETPTLIRELLTPLTYLLFVHSAYAKGTNASAALRSTTTGVLGDVHGLRHEQRAALGLMLCARWGGDLPPTDEEFAERLRQLIGPQIAWWTAMIGAIGTLVAAVFPAGVAASPNDRLSIASDVGPTGKKGTKTIGLSITFISSGLGGDDGAKTFEKQISDIEKVGKKKNWIGGKEGFGFKVAISTRNT